MRMMSLLAALSACAVCVRAQVTPVYWPDFDAYIGQADDIVIGTVVKVKPVEKLVFWSFGHQYKYETELSRAVVRVEKLFSGEPTQEKVVFFVSAVVFEEPYFYNAFKVPLGDPGFAWRVGDLYTNGVPLSMKKGERVLLFLVRARPLGHGHDYIFGNPMNKQTQGASVAVYKEKDTASLVWADLHGGGIGAKFSLAGDGFVAEPALTPDNQGRKVTVRGNDSFFFPRSPASGPPPAEVQKLLAQGASKSYPLSLLDTSLAASKVLKGRTPLGLCQEAQERGDPSEVLSKCAHAASRGYEMAKGILAETYKRQPPGSAVKDPEAQLWIGLFYLLGEGGMTKSCAEAQKWLAKAAAQGNENAKRRLPAGGGPPCFDATVKMSVAERLSSPDPATQAQAGAELAVLPDARKAKLAESLIASLPESAPVLNVLGKPALPALEKALESKNPNARAVAANMLYLDEYDSGCDDRCVPRWTRMLTSDESPDARAVAASALMLQWSKRTLVLRDEAREKPYQPMAPEVYAAFEHALLKDSDADVRKQAARSLFGAGRDAEPILAAAISDPDQDVRFISINALSYLGPQAAKAVPKLVKALKDPQERVRKAAANALAEIAPTVPGAKAEETGLEGAFYPKDYQTPPEVEVSFEDKAGNLYTFTALEGTVTIYTEPGLEPKVRKAVDKNGGKLIAAIPKAGLYWSAVDPKRTAAFIKALFKSDFIDDAFPTFALGPASLGGGPSH